MHGVVATVKIKERSDKGKEEKKKGSRDRMRFERTHTQQTIQQRVVGYTRVSSHSDFNKPNWSLVKARTGQGLAVVGGGRRGDSGILQVAKLAGGLGSLCLEVIDNGP